MANQQDDRVGQRGSSDYMRGGKGRRDDVAGSGVYPASGADVPADAEPRTPGEFVRHRGRRDDQRDQEEPKTP